MQVSQKYTIILQVTEGELGQAIYSWRSVSVEPLIEHIKDASK